MFAAGMSTSAIHGKRFIITPPKVIALLFLHVSQATSPSWANLNLHLAFHHGDDLDCSEETEIIDYEPTY